MGSEHADHGKPKRQSVNYENLKAGEPQLTNMGSLKYVCELNILKLNLSFFIRDIVKLESG
jgi:hypothetical protein